MTSCPYCGSDGREAMELARLRAKHRQFAVETNQLLTEQAAEIQALRSQDDQQGSLMSFARHYDNPRLALWYRVCLYAVDHDGQPLDRGELLRAVDPLRLVRPAEISRAIRHGISKGMLKPGSSSSLLLFMREDEAA